CASRLAGRGACAAGDAGRGISQRSLAYRFRCGGQGVPPGREAAGRKLGLRMHILDARTENDIDPAFGDFAEKKVKGLLVADDPFFQGQRSRIVGLAGRRGLPAIYFSRDFVDAGGLMSYGPNLVDVYRLVGMYCGRILKGEKPADLPVVQPTRFELVINL